MKKTKKSVAAPKRALGTPGTRRAKQSRSLSPKAVHEARAAVKAKKAVATRAAKVAKAPAPQIAKRKPAKATKTGRAALSPVKRAAARAEDNRIKNARRAELLAIRAKAKENAKKATVKAAKVSRSRKGTKGGRPRFEPTEAQRVQVETLAGLGMRYDEIAIMIENPATGEPIDKETLTGRFARELERGPVLTGSKVSESLYRKSIGNGTQAVTAAIWWTKARMGWRERVAVEVDIKSGVLVPPSAVSPEEWIAAAAVRAAVSIEPGTRKANA